MLKINLVPEKTKKEINLKNTYGMIKGLNYTLIFLAVVLSAVFISSKTFLLENTDPENMNVSLPKIDNEDQKKPRIINNKLNTLEEIIEGNISHFDIIKNSVSKIPNGVSLSRLKIDTENKIIEIRGRADLRDTLLKLKDNLEQDALYKKINFPLQNILKKEKIDFSISANLNLEELNKEEGEKTEEKKKNDKNN